MILQFIVALKIAYFVFSYFNVYNYLSSKLCITTKIIVKIKVFSNFARLKPLDVENCKAQKSFIIFTVENKKKNNVPKSQPRRNKEGSNSAIISHHQIFLSVLYFSSQILVNTKFPLHSSLFIFKLDANENGFRDLLSLTGSSPDVYLCPKAKRNPK